MEVCTETHVIIYVGFLSRQWERPTFFLISCNSLHMLEPSVVEQNFSLSQLRSRDFYCRRTHRILCFNIFMLCLFSRAAREIAFALHSRPAEICLNCILSWKMIVVANQRIFTGCRNFQLLSWQELSNSVQLRI